MRGPSALSMRAILAAMALVGVGIASATAQECRTYADSDCWLANPATTAGGYFRASATWENCLVTVSTPGTAVADNARVIDFTNPLLPVQRATRSGSCYAVAVEGNLAALCSDGVVDLVDLPNMTFRRRITTEPGRASAAFQGNRLAIAVNRWLGVYDVAATMATGPALLSEVRLSGDFAQHYFSYSWQWKSGVVFAHDTIVTWAYGGNNIGGWLGEMMVVRAQPDSALVVTESVDNFPGGSGATSYPTCVVAAGAGFLASGFLSAGYPPPYHGWAILAGFRVENGQVQWGQSVTAASGTSIGRGLVVDDNRALWSNERYTTTDPDFNTTTLHVVEFPSDLTTIQIVGSSRMFAGGELGYITAPGVLAIDASTYRFRNWNLVRADFGGELRGGSRLAALASGAGILLGWNTSANPAGGASWSLRNVDLTGASPRLTDYIDGYSWDVMQYFAASDSGLFYGMYSRPEKYLDLRDPPAIGGPFPTGLTYAGYATWRNHLVTVRDSTLTVYSPSHDGHQVVLGSIHPVPNYAPTAVGGTVYLKSTYSLYHNTTIVDLADPAAPTIAGQSWFRGTLLLPFGDVLLAIDGSSLTRLDVTDPRAPVIRGTQDIGTTVYDAVLHGDRLYLALGSRGTGVYRFSLSEGAVPIGGDVEHWSAQLESVNGRLLISPGPGYLPLDCADPLPTLVSGFAGVASREGVTLTWFAHGSPADGWLRLLRIADGTETELARRPLVSGANDFLDVPPTGTGTLRYALDLCRESDSCIRLDEILVARMIASLSPLLSLIAAPNPLNTGTTISFELASDGDVDCSVFDLAGRRIRTLASGGMFRGAQMLAWDGCDQNGRRMGAGAYIIRVATPRGLASTRVVVFR